MLPLCSQARHCVKLLVAAAVGASILPAEPCARARPHTHTHTHTPHSHSAQLLLHRFSAGMVSLVSQRLGCLLKGQVWLDGHQNISPCHVPPGKCYIFCDCPRTSLMGSQYWWFQCSGSVYIPSFRFSFFCFIIENRKGVTKHPFPFF